MITRCQVRKETVISQWCHKTDLQSKQQTSKNRNHIQANLSLLQISIKRMVNNAAAPDKTHYINMVFDRCSPIKIIEQLVQFRVWFSSISRYSKPVSFSC